MWLENIENKLDLNNFEFEFECLGEVGPRSTAITGGRMKRKLGGTGVGWTLLVIRLRMQDVGSMSG